MSRLDGMRNRGRGVLTSALTGLEHTVSSTAQVQERGKGLKHKDPMCLRPHRVQKSNQLMHETRLIITNESRDAKKR